MTFDDNPWIYAAAAVVAGFVIGAILAAVTRRALGSQQRRQALRTIATPTATFLFWLSAITGIVAAVGVASPDTLRPIPSDILAWLPKALVAGLIVLAGYAGGGAIAAAISSGVRKATGQRPAGLEQGLRWAVLTAAVILALGNLGVQTTSLQILVAGVVFAVALSSALIAGLGGRQVASNIATGRTLRSELVIGDLLTVGDLSGTIVELRPAVLIIERQQGTNTIVPFSLLLDQPFDITKRQEQQQG